MRKTVMSILIEVQALRSQAVVTLSLNGRFTLAG